MTLYLHPPGSHKKCFKLTTDQSPLQLLKYYVDTHNTLYLLVQTWPTVQMATHSHNGFPPKLIAYVALKCAAVTVAVAVVCRDVHTGIRTGCLIAHCHSTARAQIAKVVPKPLSSSCNSRGGCEAGRLRLSVAERMCNRSKSLRHHSRARLTGLPLVGLREQVLFDQTCRRVLARLPMRPNT